MPNFVQLKRTIRQMHTDFGRPISSREAHSIAQGVVLHRLAEQFSNAAEAYFRQTSDPTGEEATDNALLAHLIKQARTERTAA